MPQVYIKINEADKHLLVGYFESYLKDCICMYVLKNLVQWVDQMSELEGMLAISCPDIVKLSNSENL